MKRLENHLYVVLVGCMAQQAGTHFARRQSLPPARGLAHFCGASRDVTHTSIAAAKMCLTPLT